MNNHSSEKIARILLDIHAVSLRPKKPFRYSSGILSPIYTDCRLLISNPKERIQIRDFYIKALRRFGPFDVIAGTATAGIPHAAWIADKLHLPMVYIRGKTKDYGRGKQIEGKIKKKQKVAVIEDLISTGESSKKTVEAIRKEGGRSSHVFSIITYGIKASYENFKANNITLISLTDLPTIVRVAEKIGYIKNKDKNIILKWAKNPTSWGKKNDFE